MPRCVNCAKGALAPSKYDVTEAGSTVVLRYTGEKVGGQALTAPSGNQYIFSKTNPIITVDGGDVPALVSLGYFIVER